MGKPRSAAVIKEFSRLDQILQFFPARNLKADYLTLSPGEKMGAHQTLSRPEVIGVLQGICWVVVDTEVYKLKKGEMICVPRGQTCNVYNRNKLRCKIIFIRSKISVE
ncbi:cupin domain-containing protein [Candidatus Falkowbacteria bacterium]|nr:cupin domain-containing protein [Candidatus Falkowbacteria bacterium]